MKNSITEIKNDSHQFQINECVLYRIRRIGYKPALKIQHKLHQKVLDQEIPGALILLEHNPVITLGVKKTSCDNLLVNDSVLKAENIEVVNTDRGGDITYHGPGQLVGYPILGLRSIRRDLHKYLRDLEDSIILLLSEYGLRGERSGSAGAWVEKKKVCSIGVAVRRWVTYHGFALNVCTNMKHFSYINPCGLNSSDMTSMSELLNIHVSVDEVSNSYIKCFEKIFNLSLVPSLEPDFEA